MRYSDDIAWRNRILRGERDAAEAFFEHHADSLHEFVVYRLGGDRNVAEDIVQETFLVAVAKLGDFDGRSTLHTWLCGIAKNKIRSHRRKRRPIPLEDLLHEADAEIDAILATVEQEELPQWVLERKETEELVGATLSSLPPDYRTALVRKYIDELSVAEIAMASGRGEKATESLLHRARQAFTRVFRLLAKRRGRS